MTDLLVECTRRPGAKDTGCRCSPECRNLATKACKARQQRQSKGVSGRVPSQPVRQRVAAFLAANPHLTVSDLARSAGVSRRTLMMMLQAPPERTVNRTTAMKVLAVPPIPDLRRPGVKPVSGVETRRQVESLLLLGWPLKQIAAGAGVAPTTLAYHNLVPTCLPTTAQAVSRVFTAHRYRLGPSLWTASKARQHGYVPWVAWDGRMAQPNARPDLDGMDKDWALACSTRLAALAAKRQAVLT